MSLNCLGLANDLADNTQEIKQQQESQQEIAQKFGIFWKDKNNVRRSTKRKRNYSSR